MAEIPAALAWSTVADDLATVRAARDQVGGTLPIADGYLLLAKAAELIHAKRSSAYEADSGDLDEHALHMGACIASTKTNIALVTAELADDDDFDASTLNATTTGPRIAEGSLTSQVGGIHSNPGQVYEGIRFTSTVYPAAAGIVYRDCLFAYNGFYLIRGENWDEVGTPPRFEWCEFRLANVQASATTTALNHDRFEFYRCHFHGIEDPIRMESNVLVDECFLSGMQRLDNDGDPDHPDCVHVQGGNDWTLRNSHIRYELDPAFQDLGITPGGMCIHIQDTFGSILGFLIEGCYVDGGTGRPSNERANFLLQIRENANGGPSGTVRNNTFVKDSNVLSAERDIQTSRTVTFSGNVWEDGTPTGWS